MYHMMYKNTYSGDTLNNEKIMADQIKADQINHGNLTSVMMDEFGNPVFTTDAVITDGFRLSGVQLAEVIYAGQVRAGTVRPDEHTAAPKGESNATVTKVMPGVLEYDLLFGYVDPIDPDKNVKSALEQESETYHRSKALLEKVGEKGYPTNEQAAAMWLLPLAVVRTRYPWMKIADADLPPSGMTHGFKCEVPGANWVLYGYRKQRGQCKFTISSYHHFVIGTGIDFGQLPYSKYVIHQDSAAHVVATRAMSSDVIRYDEHGKATIISQTTKASKATPTVRYTTRLDVEMMRSIGQKQPLQFMQWAMSVNFAPNYVPEQIAILDYDQQQAVVNKLVADGKDRTVVNALINVYYPLNIAGLKKKVEIEAKIEEDRKKAEELAKLEAEKLAAEEAQKAEEVLKNAGAGNVSEETSAAPELSLTPVV